ncbi:MAG: SurA N-terminal domain-containing protein [Alphaproteobacteria bacterium]|nr:SurA N-terminal domain-containing protein [Alphaproteobacteria bacterium]
MLEAMRNATKSWVMKIILGLLALTFVVFFGSDFGGGGHGGGSSGASSVVEVGDQNFTIHQVSRAFNEEIRQVSARTGQRIDQETAVNIGLLDQAIARLVTESLFDQAAQNLGVAASQEAAVDAIRSLPQFQDATGRFSRAQFEAFLANQGQSEAAFVNDVQFDLLRNQYVGTLQNAMTAPAPLHESLYNRRAERRVADVLTVPLAEPATIADPSESELAAFFEENRNFFEVPELRRATLASMDPERLAATIDIPAEELEEEYEARLDEFTIRETRDVQQATFSSRDEAARALELVRGGTTFDAAAEQVSGLPPVALEGVTRADIPVPVLADEIFALAPDTISEPVESDLGWHLARVSNVVPGRTRSFEEVRGELRDELAREESLDLIFDVLNDVEDGLAGGGSLDEVARDANLDVSRLPGITRGGLTRSGDPVDNPAVNGELLLRLFSLENTDEAEVVENREGGFVVVRLDEVVDPAVPPLSDIRDRVISAWKEDRAREAAEERASTIAERARNGESLESLAGEFGATFSRTNAFDRTGDGASVTQPLIAPIFEARQDEIVELPVSAGAAVAKVVEIRKPDLSAPEREELARAIGGQLANDLIAQLGTALENEIAVDVDRDALEAALLNP